MKIKREIVARSMMRALFLGVFLMLFGAGRILAAPDRSFDCGDAVEAEVWTLWDTKLRTLIQKSIVQDRLLAQGDAYALYDFQTYAHNAVSMARRCGRTDRLWDIGKVVRMAYEGLEPATTPYAGRRWICRGGKICNRKSHLFNTEVMLYSVQFLGLATSTANALLSSKTALDKEQRDFITDTTRITIEHLLRWSDDATIGILQAAAEAKPEDVKNGANTLLFTDRELWLITIYAELATLLTETGSRGTDLVPLTDGERKRLRNHLGALVNFFSARTTFQRKVNSRLPNLDQADVDRGYWRFTKDSRYAGYEKAEKPVECFPAANEKERVEPKVRVAAESLPVRDDTGWDISHARRLVHALDALERNQEAIKKAFSMGELQPVPSALARAFANTLVATVWNGDAARPLFANYWSGANGWYRVGYGNAAGRCMEGYPPYGMSDAFITGGYVTWARYQPVIGALGQRIYQLARSGNGSGSTFIRTYYTALDESTSAQRRNLTEFMFFPTLVGISNK